MIRICFKKWTAFINLTLREKLDKSIVDKIIGTKMRFGMGLPVKHKKSRKIV